MVNGTEFSWVKERIKCSATKAFVELKRLVEQDAKDRNGNNPGTERPKLEVDGDINSFTVFRYLQGVSSNAYTPKSVEFSLHGDIISVKFNNKTLTATLTLNKDGQCVFKVGEEELKSWQFRMKALEDLFFS